MKLHHLIAGSALMLAMALASSARASSGCTFYVDARNGDDHSSGQSHALAWKTIAAVDAHHFKPGEHLCFHAGQQFPGVLRPVGSGSIAAPVTVGSYGTGPAPRLTGDGERATILLSDLSSWTLRNLEVQNDGSQEARRTGILVEATQSGETVRNITIKHVHVLNVRGLTGEENVAKDTGGIGLFAPPLPHPAHFEGIFINHCLIEHVDNIGVWLNTSASVNPSDPQWLRTSNRDIRIVGNTIRDTGRNAIIIRQALAPLIAGNTVAHASARHHGNAIFTRSTRDARIRGNEVSYTGTGPSGENAAFDADIDSFGTIIEKNWSHDNQGGLFSLNNNPSDERNETDGTVVRFNVSEDDGVRAFGFSGRVTHSSIYNNTVLIGFGREEAFVEARPFSESNPHFADAASIFNNIVIVQGTAFYDLAKATHLQIHSNCVVGMLELAPGEKGRLTIPNDMVAAQRRAKSWHALSTYRAAAKACGHSETKPPAAPLTDVSGVGLRALTFRGALQP